jgi:hypothetical protein
MVVLMSLPKKRRMGGVRKRKEKRGRNGTIAIAITATIGIDE